MTYIDGYVIKSRFGYLTNANPARWSLRPSDAILYNTKGDAEDDRSMFATGGSVSRYQAREA